MRRASIVLLIALGAVSPAAAREFKIVGGADAPAGKFPYVANVAISGVGGCTGSLVAPTWVITAGHCVSTTGLLGIPLGINNNPAAFKVTLGTENANGTGGEVRKVRAVYAPDEYVATNGTGYDVALLELTEPATVAPVKIAAPSERAIWEPGDLMTIAGFGVTTPDGETPDRLQAAEVPIVSDPDCARAYSDTTPIVGNAFDPKTAVCAGFPQGGKDTCQGDSGGPLLAPLDGGFRLVGATSYGEGCAEEGFPGVYARLAEGPVKSFIEGKVPEAYATPAASPTATPTIAPTGTPTGTPSPTPTSPCTKAVRYRVAPTSGTKLRRLTVRSGGRVLGSRRGKRVRPFTVDLTKRLARGRDTRVKVIAVARKGRKQVTVLTFRGCGRKPIESVTKTP